MEYLRKAWRFLVAGPQLPWHAAVAIVTVIAYSAVTLTLLFGYGMAAIVLSKTLLVFIAVLLFMTLVFVMSQILGRIDIVDAAWSLAFVIATITSFALNSHGLVVGANAQTLVSAMVGIWALRLTYHIVRRLRSHPEDKRYVDLRKKWRGSMVLNSYVRIFVVQAVLATIISLVVIHINFAEPMPIGPWAFVGGLIWLVGFGFEAIGDWQLKQHLAQSPKTLMTTGLWQYTRHPNYFGESLQWWGIFVIALGTNLGGIGIISPLTITYLLLFVSGVPLTEKAFEGRAGWSAYKKRTSMFIPRLPRR